MTKTIKELNWVNLVLFLVTVFAVFIQIFQPTTAEEKITSVIYFLALLLYVGVLYSILWASGKVKSYTDQIEENKKDIHELRDVMKTETRFDKIEKKLSFLEGLNKKGEMNPQWFLLLILLVLLYLYLRSVGIVP